MELVAIAFLVVLAIWFYGIWRAHEEKMKHRPR